MRVSIVSVLTVLSVTSSFGQETVHRYGPEDRYAGCMFGEMVPLLRRGYSRDKALFTASRRCEPLAAELTQRQVQDAVDYVNFSIDMMDR